MASIEAGVFEGDFEPTVERTPTQSIRIIGTLATAQSAETGVNKPRGFQNSNLGQDPWNPALDAYDF